MRFWLLPWQFLFLLVLAAGVLVDGAAVDRLPSLQDQGPEISMGNYLLDSEVEIPARDGRPEKVTITGLVEKKAAPATSAGNLAGPVDILDWRIEYLPRDYTRPEKPYGETLIGHLRLRNRSSQDLSGVVLQVFFADAFGRLLHQEEVVYNHFIRAGQAGEYRRFWYVEDNEFAASDSFDVLRTPLENGTLRLHLKIREVFLLPPESKISRMAE